MLQDRSDSFLTSKTRIFCSTVAKQVARFCRDLQCLVHFDCLVETYGTGGVSHFQVPFAESSPRWSAGSCKLRQGEQILLLQNETTKQNSKSWLKHTHATPLARKPCQFALQKREQEPKREAPEVFANVNLVQFPSRFLKIANAH